MNRRYFFGLSFLLLASSLLHAQNTMQTFPAPTPPANQSTLGRNIQRTMRLLATSTAGHRNTVKVLFYGQSITEQTWSKLVADDLRRRFPHANLIIENRAIGGFSSQYLVNTAEHDLYPFYPDLLIFYVYGSHIEYENIIRRVRERTTSEIIIQNEHVTKDEDLREETEAAKVTHANWSAWMSYNFLPQLAQKYGTELIDQRSAWKQYLAANKLPAKALLKDGVHLNEYGNFLMAELVKPYLRHDPTRELTPSSDTVQDFVVGRDIQWHNGKLKFNFDGNRIDLIPAQSTLKASAQVLIDGRKPSQFPELYTITRPSKTPNVGWPAIIRIDHEKPLVLEEWTATIHAINEDASQFKFSVSGSITGPDGEGSSDARFVSNSGRVIIEPDKWHLHRDWELSKKGTPEGYKVLWRVVPMFTDIYSSPTNVDPTIDNAVTLAQGLSNGHHTLELVAADQAPAIKTVRVYRPPVKP